MTQTLENYPSLSAFIDCAMPLHINLNIPDLQKCYISVAENADLTQTNIGKSPAWQRRAYEEISKGIALLEKLLKMTDKEILAFSVNDLSDFEIACFASYCMPYETDDIEISRKVSNRNSEVFLKLLDSGEPSILLYYDWIYSEIIEYDMIDDDDEYMKAVEKYVGYTFKYLDEEHSVRALSVMALNCYRTFKFDKAEQLFVALFESYPQNKDVLEAAHDTLAMIKGGQNSKKQTAKERELGQTLCSIVSSKRTKTSKRKVRAIGHGILPGLKSCPVKVIQDF